MIIRRINVWVLGLSVIVGGHFASSVIAEGLEDLELPVFDNRDGYAFAVTKFEAASRADLLNDKPAEHELSLSGLLQPPSREDVLCFRLQFGADSAEDGDGKDVLLPNRRRVETDFVAVLPRPELGGRPGKPLLIAEVELESINFEVPATKLKELTLVTQAVVVDKREEEEIAAIVADRFVDIGHDTQVQVTAMEVDRKGVMTVKLDLKRGGGNKGPVIDSLFALNKRGKVIGGGRWINELDLFANGYEVELVFPLNGEAEIANLRIVMATKYDIEEVKIVVKDLFED